MPKFSIRLFALASALCLVAGAAVAATPVSVANQGDAIGWQVGVANDGVDLRVTGPKGFLYEAYFAPGDSIAMPLFTSDGATLLDGKYRWSLTSVPVVSDSLGATMDAARDAGTSDQLIHQLQAEGKLQMVSESGTFRIADGAATIAGTASQLREINVDNGQDRDLATKDQVIADDLIVDGSICAGQDCVNGESFGFDTLRLKENNLRIKFQDTSNSASFPSNDWQLTANDSSNGGANKFSIDDIDNARTPFTIEASAPSNSLYVDDGGRVGLGTSTPVVELHVPNGDTPTLRLEQNGTSGFTPQTWDIAGNESNFFIRDVTNGSRLSFRIQPGAPDASIYVDSVGEIGFGTTSPSEELHIRRTSGNAAFRLERATGGDWTVRSVGSGQFQFSDNTAVTIPFRLGPGAQSNLLNVGMNDDGTAAVTDAVNITGSLFINTTQVTPDFVFEPDYQLETIEEHAAFMWQNKHLPAVEAAQVNEDGKSVVSVGSRSQGVLEELEKAHIYIEQLHKAIGELNQRLDQIEAADKE